MSVELLRTVKQLGINTKLVSTCKATKHNINQLITGTRMYKEKNIAFGFFLIFPSNFFSQVMNSGLSFLASFAYRLFQHK